jgi:hypothetical protein
MVPDSDPNNVHRRCAAEHDRGGDYQKSVIAPTIQLHSDSYCANNSLTFGSIDSAQMR